VKILYIGKMKNIVVYLLLLHTKDE
jgi:hypothetical protein